MNQFHDTLTGTHVPEAHTQIDETYTEADRIGSSLLDEALQWISKRIKLPDRKEKGIAVFNSLSWERPALIALPMDEEKSKERSFLDLQGRELESQFHEGQLFVSLPRVPSIGWTTIFPVKRSSLSPTEKQGKKQEESGWCSYQPEKRHIATPLYSIQWNDNGELISIFDRSANREMVSAPANQLQVFDDDPGEKFSAWDIPYHIYEHQIPMKGEGEWQCLTIGPLFAVFSMKWKVLNSSIEQQLYLYRNSPLIEFKTSVLWQDPCKLLKTAFPFTISRGTATTHLPFGAVRRSTHRNTSWEQAKYETLMHYWADLSEPDYGVTILNDCKYGCDIKDNTIRLSLVRSPIRPDAKSDMGEHHFSYALFPHKGSWTDAGSFKKGYDYNIPVLSSSIDDEHTPEKALPLEYQFLHTQDPNVVVETMKEAESGEGFMLRSYEATGSSSRSSIRIHEAIREVVETNLMETPLEENEHSGGDKKEDRVNDLSDISYGPFEIKTHFLRF